MVSDRKVECNCKTEWYFNVFLHSDPGSHKSTINLAASHNKTYGTQSVFLTTAHSEKVGGGGARWKKSSTSMPFCLLSIFIFVYGLWHPVLSSILHSSLVFVLSRPRLNCLTTWHHPDPNLSHLYRSLTPLHITPPCRSLELDVAHTGHVPFV